MFCRVVYCIVGALCLVATGYDFLYIRSSEASEPNKEEERVVIHERTSSDTAVLIHPDIERKQQYKPG